ncbi:MAG: hypothetical protein FD123_1362 [Bacteroidetes bacterium]|nr:MAG: hypothetical protein FD123_1362 [Bacteroidota bacterium]
MKRFILLLFILSAHIQTRADALGCPTCGDCWDAITPDLTRCHAVVLNSRNFPDFDFYVDVDGSRYRLRDSVIYIAQRQFSLTIEAVPKKVKGKTNVIFLQRSQPNQAITVLSVEEDRVNGEEHHFVIRYAKEQLNRKLHVRGKANLKNEPKVLQSSAMYGYLSLSLLSLFALFLQWRKRKKNT